jgi:RNA polymerase sigma-70 factor (ECF subfamily)
MSAVATRDVSIVPSSLDVWVRRMAAGETEALAPLFDAMAQRVFAVAQRILRCEADAEETVADVFQQLWRDAARFDPARGSVEAWVLRVAYSRAIDRLRHRRARPDEATGVHPDELHAPYTPQDDPAGDLLGALERESLVRAAFATLGREQQRCVALAFLEGLSHSEVAARLDLPLGTVKSHVRRGLQAMRAFLEARGHHGFAA